MAGRKSKTGNTRLGIVSLRKEMVLIHQTEYSVPQDAGGLKYVWENTDPNEYVEGLQRTLKKSK